MPTTSTPAPQLGYAPAPKWSQRRLVRRFVIPLVTLSVAFPAWRWGPAAVSHLKMLELQRRCLAYAPPERVMYDDDPRQVPRLLQTPGFVPSHPAVQKPRGAFALYDNPVFQSYQQAVTGAGRPVAPAVFMHRLTSPGGNKRLVVVSFTLVPPGGAPFDQFVLRPAVEAPRSLVGAGGMVGGAAGPGGATGLEMFVAAGDRTRVMEGRADPADPAHFTIDYVHNDVAGTIDGWLNDDDTVTLGPRAGDVLELNATYRWWSPVPGALPPHVYRGGPLGATGPFDTTTRPALPKRDDPRFSN